MGRTMVTKLTSQIASISLNFVETSSPARLWPISNAESKKASPTESTNDTKN